MITYCVIYNKGIGKDRRIDRLENFAKPKP